MTDMPTAGAAPGEPSEEEVRQYLAQMRGAPAEQVVAEVLQGLLNAAQVKLGRRDARLLLDAAGDVAERTGPHLSADLRNQLDDALSQLRLGQVEAEKEVAVSGHEEVNDLPTGAPADDAGAGAPTGQPATPPSAGQPSPTPTPSPGDRPGGPQGGGPDGQSPLDRLWIPGR